MQWKVLLCLNFKKNWLFGNPEQPLNTLRLKEKGMLFVHKEKINGVKSVADFSGFCLRFLSKNTLYVIIDRVKSSYFAYICCIKIKTNNEKPYSNKKDY
jgi:hypothetical protein